MKKILKGLLLVAIAITLTLSATIALACYPCGGGVYGDTDSPDSCPPVEEPKVVPEPSIESSGYCFDCYQARIKNIGMRVEGNTVIVDALTTQPMTLTVIASYNDHIEKEAYGIEGTGHTIAMQINNNGVYDIEVFATNKDTEGYKYLGEVNITSNEEDDLQDILSGINFKDGLTQEQLESIINLFLNKAMDLWTATDKANWNYAVR